jgi:hypothetical protein
MEGPLANLLRQRESIATEEINMLIAERLDPLIHVFARMTTRLSQTLEQIGLATNAEGGTRLAEHLGMTTSPTTRLAPGDGCP